MKRPTSTDEAYDLPRVRRLLEQIEPTLGALDDAALAKMLRHAPVAAADAMRRRWQDAIIERLIPAGSSVLDLGCGDGKLLARLIATKRVRGQGIELDADAVFQCVARGVPVLQSDLDAGLRGFADQGFEYVVLEQTLQTLYRPVDVLRDMLRVGHRGIVSFPNFGHWQVRLDLALRGRMPVTDLLPYRWYDTPNIHLFTLRDFRQWADEARVRLVEGHVLGDQGVRPLTDGDNLFAREILVVVEQDRGVHPETARAS